MNPRNKIPVIEGTKYGNLMLTGKSGVKNNRTVVEAVCNCGSVKEYFFNNLRRGNTTSCGCYQKEIVAKVNFRHGLTTRVNRHPLYHVYCSMKERCYNKKTRSYKNYGLRGIVVCDEWINDFVSFFNWAVKSGWKRGLTLERKENNGNYEPSNCRWATSKEQARNKSINIFLTAFGETKCLMDWSKDNRCVVSLNGLWLRIKKGWNAKEAITTPSMNIKRAA